MSARTNGPIIDAQLHDVGPCFDWTGAGEAQQHQVMAETVVAYMDAVGVDRVILFPGGHDDSAAWAAAQLPDRFVFVPAITPDTLDIDAAVRAARERRSAGQIGLRAILGWPLDGAEIRRFESGAWDPIFAACERHDVPLFLFITGWLEHAADIATRFPGLTLIIDHLGLRQPPLDKLPDDPFGALPELLALARFPQVRVKLCGLPALSRAGFPFRDANGPLRQIVDAFGADRLMWASDATRFKGRIGIGRYQNPTTVGPYVGKHSYSESLAFIQDSDVLTGDEKADILGGTARRLFAWGDTDPES